MPAHPLHHRTLAQLNPQARPNLKIRLPPVRDMVARALTGGILPKAPAITPKQKLAQATGNETLYRNIYLQCKTREINKGNTVYPDDPKGKCKQSWKNWQHYRGAVGEHAIAVAEAAERRGQLSVEQQEYLQADQARATDAPAPLTEADIPYLPGGEHSTAPLLSLPAKVVLGGVAILGTVAVIWYIRR